MRILFGGFLVCSAMSSALVAGCGGATTTAVAIGSDGGVDAPGTRPDSGRGVDSSTSRDAKAAPDAVGGSLDGSLRPPPSDGGQGVDAAASPDAGGAPPDSSATQPDAGSKSSDASSKPDATGKPDSSMGIDSGRAACPGTAPANFATCATAGEACNYPTEDCTCSALLAWNCTACPASEPTAGATCTGVGIGGADECTYGADQCICTAGKWACGSCPAIEPVSKSGCTVAGLTCPYSASDDTCRCDSAFAGGTMPTDEWTCTGTCPTLAPTPGDTCNVDETTGCMYGMETCTCRSLLPGGTTTWFCN